MRGYYAAFSRSDVSPGLVRAIRRIGEVLGPKMMLRTALDSEFGQEFMRAHDGHKCSFADFSGWNGHFFGIEPPKERLRPIALKQIPGWVRLSQREKQLGFYALSCLYGHTGNVKGLEVARFVITYEPIDLDLYLPTKIARDLGFKVINLAELKGVKEIAFLLGKLK